jgi:leader peptidase (prepilin peptidase)/N-methyltransferase
LSSVVESAIGAALAGGLFWAIRQGYSSVRKREGMGLGDVKMAAMLGAFLGFEWTLVTVMVGSVIGLVASLIFIVVKRKDASTYELPFGSFIGLAALAVALGLLRHPLLG